MDNQSGLWSCCDLSKVTPDRSVHELLSGSTYLVNGMKQRNQIAGYCLPCIAAWGLALAAGEAHAIDFARDVRPILSDRCFHCHGPDESSREADLRLDKHSSVIEDRGGYRVVSEGNADGSELISRIESDDPYSVMPPPETGPPLSAEEIATLRKWINDGAAWSGHWAFEAPVRPKTPDLSSGTTDGWSVNPIDAFVLNRLGEAGLAPSAPAPRETLLRRLYLDLIGLPPTPKERDEFLNDSAPGATQRLVDRLLDSPHYGERWGRHWLDAARYSDSDGYEKDLMRQNWFYRDWVVEAVNADMPYDDFIVAQVAGDLLPDAGQDERVATGFLRNSMVNEEGGADPEQFRVEALFDRMDAIGKAILGITTQCAQCHTHKYDPLTHHDYFGMLAYLNSTNESVIAAYTADEQQRIQEIRRQIATIEDELRANTPDWRERLSAWAAEAVRPSAEWKVHPVEMASYSGQKFEHLEDGSIVARSYAPPLVSEVFTSNAPIVDTIRAVRLELLTHPDLPRGGPGRSRYGTNALSEFKLEHRSEDAEWKPLAFASATSDVRVDQRPIGEPFVKANRDDDKRKVGPIEYAFDGDVSTAWTTQCGPADRNQPREAVFVLEEPFEAVEGTELRFTLNQHHGGHVNDQKNNNLVGRFRFSTSGQESAAADPLPHKVRTLVDRGVATWSNADWEKVFSQWRTTRREWADANERIEALLAEWPEGTNQYVVSRREEPRVTHRMDRGDFLSPAEVVRPHTPDFLHTIGKDQTNDRLAYARWLVDRRSPTTARAFVNRVWQAYFGVGLVETAEDLGSQAPPPSHPALLDWLSVEFMDRGWSLKHLHRLITSSATYQQASTNREGAAESDPYNRLLWRGPRGRVEAEVVRDIALAASGLLDRRLGGPTVYPPAPRFLFVPPASYGKKPWKTVQGTDNFRRSLYVQAYRSVQYPPLQVFDAPSGAVACVRRTRSNTPLQALTMLNEEQFVACARALAWRLMDREEATDASRIEHAYVLLLSRSPGVEELATLTTFVDDSRKRVTTGEIDALAVTGLPNTADSKTARELAVWTLTARCLLNLDETITKP